MKVLNIKKLILNIKELSKFNLVIFNIIYIILKVKVILNIFY